MINLKELKKHIVMNIKPEWSTLEKVRYVYIESGKYLQKHTEFFLTVDEKLGVSKLSPRKLDKIYQGRLNSEEWNKMVCKTGAEFIKDVLDVLDIKSFLVETVEYMKIKGMKNHLHHFTLCINVDGNNIFVTPASDYPYIKRGMSTKHFGIDVPYMINGEQIYKGLEIDHIVLTKEEIRKLDEKIGYITIIQKPDKKGKEEYRSDYIDDLIKKEKNAYVDFLAENTSFYQSIMPDDESKREFTSFSDPKNNWNFIIDRVCNKVGKRISQITGKKYDTKQFISKNKINEWCEKVESMFNKDDYNQNEVYYANPNLLLNKTRAFCNSIVLFYDKIINKKCTDKDIESFHITYFRLLKEMARHFIEDKFVIEPKNYNKYVNNTYINHKFATLFPIWTDANNGHTTNFTNEGFSEQTEILKRTIELMFQELNSKNLLKTPDNSFKYSPIFKRINLYTARKRNSNDYIAYIAITDSDTLGTTSSYWYKYDFNENTFEKTHLSKIIIESSVHGKYEVISNRLKRELGDIEEKTETGIIRKRELILN
ncbi:MAG: hypothetical protein IKF36_03480 [Bacilli bacterium]|nr:hypothetical protein [Bacilli bacterium]